MLRSVVREFLYDWDLILGFHSPSPICRSPTVLRGYVRRVPVFHANA